MRQRRLKEKEPEFLNRYRWRAGIEGTMSRLKHVMGMVCLASHAGQSELRGLFENAGPQSLPLRRGRRGKTAI